MEWSTSKEAYCVHMYSYPNLIPLPAQEIRRMRDMMAPYAFERLYSAWFERVVSRTDPIHSDFVRRPASAAT